MGKGAATYCHQTPTNPITATHCNILQCTGDLLPPAVLAQSHANTHIQTHTHAHTHTQAHTYMYTDIYSYIHGRAWEGSRPPNTAAHSLRTHTHARTHACAQPHVYIRTNMKTHIHTYTLTTHPYTYICIHANIRIYRAGRRKGLGGLTPLPLLAHKHTQTHTHTHALTHTSICIHTYNHAKIYTYMHTNMQTNTYIQI